MGQSEEDAIKPFQLAGIGHGHERQVGQLRQVRMDRIDPFPGMLAGGDQLHLDLRVKEQDPEQLAAAVAGAPYDSCLDHLSNLSLTMRASRSPWLSAFAAGSPSSR